jgi:ribosomal protein S18 acetylase RimI-like enzyme
MKIVDFNSDLAPHFEAINRQWIAKYFTMEPIDEAVLSKPIEHIINPGGAILFAIDGEEVVGTVALKKHDDQVVELTKMGVYEQHRNGGIGQLLIDAALDKARAMGFSKIILYSNRKLENAIYLYRKTGFTEFSTCEQRYERCDIQMERSL